MNHENHNPVHPSIPKRMAKFFIVHLGPSLVLLALLPQLHTQGCLGRFDAGWIPPAHSDFCPGCAFQHYVPMTSPEQAPTPAPPLVASADPLPLLHVTPYSTPVSTPPAHAPPRV